MFTDDCAVYREVTSSSDDVKILQHNLDLRDLNLYKVDNYLATSPKCKALKISNKRTTLAVTYNLNRASLEWVNSFTYLGVVINNKLSWSDHVDAKVAKASCLL